MPIACAQRQPRQELAASCQTDSQLQVGNVDTRDQQHQRDGAGQGHEDAAGIEQPELLHALHRRTFPFVLLVTGAQHVSQSRHLIVRLLEGHAIGQTASDIEGMRSAILVLFGELNGNPYAVTFCGEYEPLRHDANHLEHLAVQMHGASDHRGIRREVHLPERVGDDRDAMAWRILLRRKDAPQRGLHP